MTGDKEGSLRERKKRAARDSIAAAARQLFAAHGYDAVKVSAVAAAADVSEKTVFNYFPSKEDLVFARRQEALAQLVADLEARDGPALDVFRTATRTAIRGLVLGGNEGVLDVARIVASTPSLRERLRLGWPDALDAAAEAIGGDPVVAGVTAHALTATHHAILLLAHDGLLAGEDPQRLARRLRTQADRAYDRLAAGLG